MITTQHWLSKHYSEKQIRAAFRMIIENDGHKTYRILAFKKTLTLDATDATIDTIKAFI